MAKVKVKCSHCGKIYLRESGRFNEAKKLGWNQYCSKKCQNQAQLKVVEKICANPNCNKKVYRPPAELKKSKSGRIFCSSSCAAIFNNSLRRQAKTCLICGEQFYGEQKYCSNLCRSFALNLRKKSEFEKREIILDKIKTFYKIEGRIPTKKEKPGLARGAQAIFGTWNKAIEAAGFKPNPVMFAKKHIANDGHRCDSFAEKIIDDWLYARKIAHKRKVSYPEDKSLTADFLISGNLVEFLGLARVIKKYDQIVRRKRRLCRKYNLSLIEIYPKDLFPKNHLEEIIRF